MTMINQRRHHRGNNNRKKAIGEPRHNTLDRNTAIESGTNRRDPSLLHRIWTAKASRLFLAVGCGCWWYRHRYVHSSQLSEMVANPNQNEQLPRAVPETLPAEATATPHPNRKKRKEPWDSKPPHPIPLLSANEKKGDADDNDDNDYDTANMIWQRHQCLAHIRERQLSLLQPSIMGMSTTATKQEVVLVDPAYHGNVGDHMITLGEQELLRRLLGSKVVDDYGKAAASSQTASSSSSSSSVYRECHYVQAGEFVPHCETVIHDQQHQQHQAPSRKVALWHGGGNWGDLWPHIQKVRLEQSFRALVQLNYSIVGMPQSLYYRHPESAAFEARLLKRELRVGRPTKTTMRRGSSISSSSIPNANFSDVVLSWREYESYNKAQQLYPYVTNIVVPDIAFQLGPYRCEDYKPTDPEQQVNFLLLLRRDHESTLLPGLLLDSEDDIDDDKASVPREPQNMTEILHNAVESAMQNAATSHPNGGSYTYRIVDWPDRLQLFHSNDPFFSDTSIQLLSMGRVVICDRLHAAILAFLSGIPFVYIDPVTGKISKTLQVAFDSWGGCNHRRPRAGGDSNMNTNRTIAALRYAKADNLTEAIEIAARL